MTEGAKELFWWRNLHKDYSSYPKYGVVEDVSLLPRLAGDNDFQNQRGGLFPLHYVEGDRVYYFPRSMVEGTDPLDCDALRAEGMTYLPSPLAMKALWYELQNYSRRFPEIPGRQLVTWDNKRKDLDALHNAGYHVQIGGFAKRDEVLGVERLLSTGFITEFGFPGEEPTVVNTLEVSASLVDATKESEPTEREQGNIDSDDLAFIRGLKEMCFSTQREHGPFAAKYAWEVYKRVARYLSEQSERVS
jgi:hypothetical protein